MMKNLLVLLVMVMFIGANADAQVTPVSGDKDLRDTDVKGRSNELERIDREAKKEDEAKKENNKDKKKNKKKTAVGQETAAPAPEPPKDALAEVYPQIKEDYESMQNSQSAIMNAYGDGKTVDYAKIGALSTEINKSAARLSANLFPPAPTETKTELKKDAEKPTTGKSLRSLLIELDEAVAGVISSPMFQNLRAVEPAVSEKTKTDLRQIVKLTEAVKAETAKSLK